MIGFAMCGSYCTHRLALEQMKALCESGQELLPIFSENVYTTDTHFGSSEALKERVTQLCHKPIIHTIVEAEPLGPRTPLDLLVICPCTGNTLAKIAMGITDTAVTMAAKAHLRSNRPLVIALASNDALSANLKNIGLLLTRKGVFFVPMTQDDPDKKPHSLVADFSLLRATIAAAKEGRQYQKIFL
ncbi:MAG: dipicolinate synthase subunit B [Clostridia bacterium]|nr:dipicolinate synthase subunit B [Clostridia bacterium]